MIKPVILTIIICFSSYSLGQSNIKITDSICSTFQKKQTELESLTKELRDIYALDSIFLENLVVTQNNWMKQVEFDLQLYMPIEEDFGSSELFCRCQFGVELYDVRIKFLSKWVQPGERKGWMCGGTILFENEELLIIDGEKY